MEVDWCVYYSHRPALWEQCWRACHTPFCCTVNLVSDWWSWIFRWCWGSWQSCAEVEILRVSPLTWERRCAEIYVTVAPFGDRGCWVLADDFGDSGISRLWDPVNSTSFLCVFLSNCRGFLGAVSWTLYTKLARSSCLLEMPFVKAPCNLVFLTSFQMSSLCHEQNSNPYSPSPFLSPVMFIPTHLSLPLSVYKLQESKDFCLVVL